MRVLVTGSAGFIGRVVVSRLAAAGHTVSSFDRADDPHDDITDLTRMRAAVSGCQAVVHLAAKVGLGVDLSDIVDYVQTNDVGTAVVLRAAAESEVPRVVYASSMVVYGEGRYDCPEHGPCAPPPRRVTDLRQARFDPLCPRCGTSLTPGLVPESAQLDPRNVYAATKVHGEHLAAAWARESNGTVAALRFHNVYGPGMPRDTPYAGVASLFRSRLDHHQAPLVFEDGQQRRNFVHVADVADAVVASVTADLGLGVTPLNIGSPWVSTIADLATELSAALDGPAPAITGEFRLGDVRHVTADCSAAEHVLGWRATIDLPHGVASLLAERR